jgi:PAS domain-containing protein
MSAEKHSPEEVALSLTLAIVTFSPTPLLLLDGRLTIIAASTSFCSAFGVNAVKLTGQPLYALDDGEWDSPQLRSLMTATMSGEGTQDVRNMDLRRSRQPVRHLIVQARQLVYLDLEQTRILVAVSDVTDAQAEMAQMEEAAHGNRILSGGSPSSRQQPADHRQRIAAQCASHHVARDARPSPERP